MRHWCLTHGICDVSKAALVDGIVVRTKYRVISNLNLRKNDFPTEWKNVQNFCIVFHCLQRPMNNIPLVGARGRRDYAL